MPDKDHPASPPRRLKVVILEDGLHMRRGMAIDLDEAGDIQVVGDSAQPTEILALIAQRAPDVAFIDLKIYGDFQVGVNTIREIKQAHPQVKCIVLTAFPELSNFLAAFDAGAEAFVAKDALPGQQPSLAELVRLVAAGGRYYDPELVGQMRRHLDETGLGAGRKSGGSARNPLSRQEQKVLSLLAQGHSNAEIAEKLVISRNTVKTHVNKIKSKLDARDRHQAVLIAISRGWLDASPPAPA